jgi:hypothetical protein
MEQAILSRCRLELSREVARELELDPGDEVLVHVGYQGIPLLLVSPAQESRREKRALH